VHYKGEEEIGEGQYKKKRNLIIPSLEVTNKSDLAQ